MTSSSAIRPGPSQRVLRDGVAHAPEAGEVVAGGLSRSTPIGHIVHSPLAARNPSVPRSCRSRCETCCRTRSSWTSFVGVLRIWPSRARSSGSRLSPSATIVTSGATMRGWIALGLTYCVKKRDERRAAGRARSGCAGCSSRCHVLVGQVHVAGLEDLRARSPAPASCWRHSCGSALASRASWFAAGTTGNCALGDAAGEQSVAARRQPSGSRPASCRRLRVVGWFVTRRVPARPRPAPRARPTREGRRADAWRPRVRPRAAPSPRRARGNGCPSRSGR